MTAQHVDTTLWAYLLAQQLIGKAQQDFTAMPSATSGSYAEVKKSILKRYNINEETYCQRFRNATSKDGETFQELEVRLAHLLDKWMKDYKADPVKVLQQVAIEQLLSRLARYIQIFVHKHKALTVIKSSKMADNLVQAGKPMPSEKAMTLGSSGPYLIKCQYCGQKGHSARAARRLSWTDLLGKPGRLELV